MALSSSRVTVGTTATPLATGNDAIVRAGAVDLFVGGSDVTAANGFLVKAGEALPVTTASDEDLYGVVASGSTAVYVLQRGV